MFNFLFIKFRKLESLQWESKKLSLHETLVISIFTDTLKAFDDFKNKERSVLGNVFGYVKVYIFWKFVQHNKHWDKTQKFLQT